MRAIRISALLAVLAAPAAAITTRTDKQTVTVPEAETLTDTLFATGETVQIDGIIDGDLIVFARRLSVQGTVKGNVVSFARIVELQGNVEGSVASFSQDARLGGSVDRNAYIWAQTMKVDSSARVNGDLAGFAERAEVAATVGRGVRLFVKSAVLGGTVGRNAEFSGSELWVADTARVTGDLTAHITNADDLHMGKGAVVQGSINRRIEPRNGPDFLFRVLFEALWLAAAFLAGVVMLKLAPRFTNASAMSLASSRWRVPLWGLVVLIALPLILLLAAVTIVGLPLAAVGAFLYLAGLYFSQIPLGLFLGKHLIRRRSPVLALLSGLAVLSFLYLLPFGIGGAVRILVLVAGLGALAYGIQAMRTGRPAASSVPEMVTT